MGNAVANRQMRAPASFKPFGWSDKVMCTDSCDSGFGVLKRTVHPDTVSKWGRQSERFRYLFEDSVSAREHALRDDPEDRRPDSPSYYDAAAAHSHGTGVFDSFSEIEKSELDEKLWTHIYSAPWRKYG